MLPSFRHNRRWRVLGTVKGYFLHVGRVGNIQDTEARGVMRHNESIPY